VAVAGAITPVVEDGMVHTDGSTILGPTTRPPSQFCSLCSMIWRRSRRRGAWSAIHHL